MASQTGFLSRCVQQGGITGIVRIMAFAAPARCYRIMHRLLVGLRLKILMAGIAEAGLILPQDDDSDKTVRPMTLIAPVFLDRSMDISLFESVRHFGMTVKTGFGRHLFRLLISLNAGDQEAPENQ